MPIDEESPFKPLELERKDLKMVLLGQCKEIHKNNYISSDEDCPCDKNNHESRSYVTKLNSILTLVCFSMRYNI